MFHIEDQKPEEGRVFLMRVAQIVAHLVYKGIVAH